MPEPEDLASSPLFERMAAEGHAALSLSLAANDSEIRTERERELVDAAVAAGVVGALEVIRRQDHADQETDDA